MTFGRKDEVTALDIRKRLATGDMVPGSEGTIRGHV